MKYYYKFIEESILLYTKCNDKINVRPAVGGSSSKLDREVMDFALTYGSDPPLGMIYTKAKERLTRQFPDLNFKAHRDYFDYVYLAQDLADLAGKKYIKLRNLANRFRKRFEYDIEAVSKENIKDVEHFLNRWCLWRDCDKIPLLESEKKAVLYCMAHFFELGVEGIAIRIEDEVEAVAIYESVNPDTAIVHFEKAIPDFDGLYQVINQETAKILAKKYKFINRESDMGYSGLRLAKMKYHPHHMGEVYHLSKDELEKIKI
jgi:hypothetical protein